MSTVCSLTDKKCVPCEGGVPPLTDDEVKAFLKELDGAWSIADGKLTRTFNFKDFSGAMEFANAVGFLANREGHHPDLEIGWGRAKVTYWTHAINGLSENDFISASKVDLLLK